MAQRRLGIQVGLVLVDTRQQLLHCLAHLEGTPVAPGGDELEQRLVLVGRGHAQRARVLDIRDRRWRGAGCRTLGLLDGSWDGHAGRGFGPVQKDQRTTMVAVGAEE